MSVAMGYVLIIAAALTFLFLLFLPFILSLFGRKVFALIALVCCCLAARFLSEVSVFPFVCLWIAALIAALVGIDIKRGNFEIRRRKRAIRKFYAAVVYDRHLETMRGKNRALS